LSAQTTKRHSSRILPFFVFLLVRRFARGDIHDLLGKLIWIAGTLA